MNQQAVFLSLVGREVRHLVRDPKFVCLSVCITILVMVSFRLSGLSGQTCFLVPLIPVAVLNVWVPNQFGLDGPGFARLVLSPQPMRAVILAKQVVLAGAFLLLTAVGVTVLLTSGSWTAADVALAIGLAVTSLFCFLSAGLALSCLRPWTMPLGFGNNLGVVDAWIGQSAVFPMAALPSFGFWLIQASLSGLGLLSLVGWLAVAASLGACLWWLAVRAAASFVERNAMAIQARLMQ